MTKIYENNGAMWFNVATDEKDDDGKFITKRINVESITPAIPKHLWNDTISKKSKYVEVKLEEFDIVEDKEEFEYPAVTTSSGTVLANARKGERTIYRLVAKE